MTDRALFEAFINASPYPVFAKDASHRWVYGNSAFEMIAGEMNFVGEKDSLLVHPVCIDRIREVERKVLAGEDSLDEETLITGAVLLTIRRPLRLPSGETLIAGIIISIIHAPDVASSGSKASLRRHELAIADVRKVDTERTRWLEQRLELVEQAETAATKAARTDPATGLRNRMGFDLDLATVAEEPLPPDKILCLAFLDLDRFKFINDSFGHKAGDTVLKSVAKRLITWPGVRSLARMGGDEFAILFDHPRVAPHVLVENISLMRQRIFRAVRVGDKLIQVSGSVGLSVHGLDADDLESLKLNADTALIEAKHLGREQVKLFDAGLALRTYRRHTLERDLRQAIARNQIVPAFQPIVNAKTRAIEGVEVLARWNHPQLGPIPAQEFITIATECGLISALDLSIVRRACGPVRNWLSDNRLRFVSFNASSLEIVRPGYAAEILSLIRRCGVQAEKVCIELVESAIIHDIDRARANICILKDRGVKIALDDYGTGYSNLRALLDLPIDRIKIDRSIIGDIGDDERAMKLVLSVVQLAKLFNAELIAEGIEDETQATYLEGMNCEFLQGFHFSPAVDAQQFDLLLTRQTSRAA
ncbi:putative diguanylate cyclase [Hyphomonas neptunium ATCC 15444]|uniref:Putative diguanylate cyclase n=2 Tax=Hyphomonas TaxID=85 RepID=Q0C5I3_HYPNA|nr:MULTISPECIES: EAL domain-containing protein [Hyphomonas]ABI75648.1 putative diguanylate cyclase [Hyphomonas neptunium ATCC 15444]KCZ95438.1 putative diguanylate cyclase [Hyphomonas hirschiana VP5]